MKHLLNLRYLIIHKWWVFYYGCQLGIPWLALLHDNSKFTSQEWLPYANFFYGPHKQTGFSKVPFLESFNEWHWPRNKHHWEYWAPNFAMAKRDGNPLVKTSTLSPSVYQTFTPTPMPDRYRREMLADWRGAGRAITGTENALGWYRENRERIMLHHETRVWVEGQLGYVADPWDAHMTGSAQEVATWRIRELNREDSE